LIERIKKLEEDIPKYKNGNKDWSSLYESASKDRTDLENKLDFEQKKYQILDHNYQGCTRYRDEYKHQLNAANKEIEVLKNRVRDWEDKYAKSFSNNDMDKLQKEIDQLKRWKKEQLTVQSWWDKVDSYVRDHDDAPLGGFVANTCLNFLKERDELKKLSEELKATTKHAIEDRDRWHNLFEEGIKQQREVEEDSKKRIDSLSLTIDRKNFEIDDLKAEIKKLKDDIVDYVIEKDDELKKAQDWNRMVHGVEIEKVIDWMTDEGIPNDEEEQKHPMYPIHWGGYDKNIKEFVESELNNEDPVDGITELLQKAKDLTEGVEVDLDKSLDEQCDPEILNQAKEQSIEEIVDTLKGIRTQGFEDYDPNDFVESEVKNEDPLEGKQVEKWCTTKIAMQDAVQAKQREVYGIEEPSQFTKELKSDVDEYQKAVAEYAESELEKRVKKLEQTVEDLKVLNNYINPFKID